MGKRKTLTKRFVGKTFSTVLWHPLSKRSVRFNLGTDAKAADGKLHWLSTVHRDPSLWRNLPEGFPEDLRAVWRDAADGVKVSRGKVLVDGRPVETNPVELARLNAIIKAQEDDIVLLRNKYQALKRRYERERGGKLREGPSPTLAEAATKWKKSYVGRDSDWTRIVFYDVDRFVRHFGENTLLDDLEGREGDIDLWLRGLTVGEKSRPIGAGRRQQIRRIVIRFLDESGVLLNRRQIKNVKKNEVRRDRGSIRWLDEKQAWKVAELLPSPWAEAFRIQTAIGLRPSELATLKRHDFSDDLSTLTLSPIPESELTLKTGPRSIGIHRFPEVRPVLEKLLKAKCDILFNVEGKAWNLKDFMRYYNKALKMAAKSAGVTMKMDARVGRRTCASILLRNGKSVEQVAALLGDNPETIREHYAAILPQEV